MGFMNIDSILRLRVKQDCLRGDSDSVHFCMELLWLVVGEWIDKVQKVKSLVALC